MPTLRIARLPLLAACALACEADITPPAEIPVLAVSAREVAMFAPRGSTTPDSATVYVANNGRGTLDGLAITQPVYQDAATGWLTATLRDTTILLEASAQNLSVQTTYTATLDVVLPQATNSPRTITVTFEVGQTQRIALSDTSLTFGAIAGGTIPPSQTVTVTNGGTGVLTELRDPTVSYAPGDPQGWLTAALGSATAPARVEVVPGSLPGPGTYHATVTVSSRIADPESDTVQVTLIVAEPPTLVLATDTLRIEAVAGDPPIVRRVRARELKLRALGGLVVAPPAQPWLAASLATGVTPDTLTLVADPAVLRSATDTARTVAGTSRVVVSSAGGGADTLYVTLRARRGPTVRASPDDVTFTMYRTGPVPAAQVVRIANAGEGTLAGLDTVAGLPSWLQASFDTRTAPAALTLQADSTGLAAGSHSGRVIVRSDGPWWDTVTVRLVVLDGPALAVSSESVVFRADSAGPIPHAVELAAANAGPGTLRGWSVALESPAPWLAVSLDTARTPARLVLQPTTTSGLQLDTAYTARVRLAAAAAAGGARTVSVRYVLSDTLPRDSIWVSPDTVELIGALDGSDLPGTVLGLTYAGSGRPSVLSRPSWLTVTRVDGDSALTVALNGIPSGSRPGTVLTGRIVVDNPRNVADTIAARLTIVGPATVLSADTVRFRAFQGQAPWPAAQRLAVANGGADTLADLRIENALALPAWLDASLDGTTAPTQLMVQPRQTFSVVGDQSFRVIVSSPLAGVTKDTLVVLHELDPGPTVGVSPSRLVMIGTEGSVQPDRDTVTVFNAGYGTLAGLQQPVPDTTWLRAGLDSAAAPVRVAVEADPRGAAIGLHTGRAEVRPAQAGQASDTLAVAFTVVPAPRIQRSPAVLAFHATVGDPVPADTQAFTVFDPAGRPTGALTVTPAGDSAWLHVEVDPATTPSTVRVWPIDVPPAGDTAYAAPIRIVSDVTGDTLPATVKYYVDLGRAPVIALSRDSLAFDRVSPPAQTVRITNGGSGTLRELSVRETTGADWLFVLFDSRIAPATLTVAVDPAKAADEPASAVARLEITGEGAEPRSITVILR